MEFGEKLQELRKRKGLTQEELALALYVSRTAISKWESGRGYPNIDSLKTIAKFFEITVDALLSGEELLTLAEEENKQKNNCIFDLLFGLLDLCVTIFFFVPLFGQNINGSVQSVTLSKLTQIHFPINFLCFSIVCAIIFVGILTLVLQNCNVGSWLLIKRRLSLILNLLAVTIFIIIRQPYAALILFLFLIIKIVIGIKKQ